MVIPVDANVGFPSEATSSMKDLLIAIAEAILLKGKSYLLIILCDSQSHDEANQSIPLSLQYKSISSQRCHLQSSLQPCYQLNNAQKE